MHGAVALLLGGPGGKFQAASNFPVGIDTRSVGVGDFNGDGKPDLAVPEYSSASGVVYILLGNGDGSFQAPTAVPINAPHPHGLTVADLDFDGKPDLAMPHQGNGIAVLLCNGDGTFQPPTTFAIGAFPTAPKVADFNADGRPDLVVGSGSTISILTGIGNGTFGAPANFVVGGGSNVTVAADFTGDGKPDAVVSEYLDAEVALLRNGDQIRITQQPQGPAFTVARHRALIALLYRGGLRISEALRLYPKDLDAATGAVRVLWGKGGKARTVGVDAGGLALVAAWAAVRAKAGIGERSPLFCTKQGQPMTSGWVRRLMPRLARRAGITKRVHAHGLRHTHAAQLRAEGVDIAVIKRQLGHSSIVTTVRYLDHLAPTAVIEAIAKRAWQ